MYRAIAGLIVLLVASVWTGATDHRTVSADEGDADTSAIVGTWEYYQAGYGASGLFTFSSDQTVIYVGTDGAAMLGAWAQDGDLIHITVELVNLDSTGPGGSLVFAAPNPNDNVIGSRFGSRLTRVTPQIRIATPFPPMGLPDPDSCTAIPRTRDEVATILADGTAPIEKQSVEHEADLPKGEQVDAETAMEISRIAYQFVACINSADWPRWLGMLSDSAIRQSFDMESLSSFFETAGTPESDADGLQQTTLIDVRDIRLLPDGRVGAVVEWGRIGAHSDGTQVDEVNFHILIRDGDTWLLDEEISGFSTWQSAGESEPDWSTEATPIAS